MSWPESPRSSSQASLLNLKGEHKKKECLLCSTYWLIDCETWPTGDLTRTINHEHCTPLQETHKMRYVPNKSSFGNIDLIRKHHITDNGSHLRQFKSDFFVSYDDAHHMTTKWCYQCKTFRNSNSWKGDYCEFVWENETQCQLCERLARPMGPFFWSCLVWKRVLPWMW